MYTHSRLDSGVANKTIDTTHTHNHQERDAPYVDFFCQRRFSEIIRVTVDTEFSVYVRREASILGSHYKCALQTPWWSLHQLLSPSQSTTTEASRGQDQEHARQPTHSYAMEEDIDVTSHTEVTLLHLTLNLVPVFWVYGCLNPSKRKATLPFCWSTKWK